MILNLKSVLAICVNKTKQLSRFVFLKAGKFFRVLLVWLGFLFLGGVRVGGCCWWVVTEVIKKHISLYVPMSYDSLTEQLEG